MPEGARGCQRGRSFLATLWQNKRRKKMERPILKCERLSKNFGKKRILNDVSFEIYEGDILGFIGPNGSR